MIPDDPLGKNGPHLDIFLRKDSWCVMKYWGLVGSVLVTVLCTAPSYTLSFSSCQESSGHASASQTPGPPASLTAAASLRASCSLCPADPHLPDGPHHCALAPLWAPRMAPTSPFSLALSLTSAPAVAGGDVRAEEKTVRHLPRPEAADRPHPQRQPVHERPERPFWVAARIKNYLLRRSADIHAVHTHARIYIKIIYFTISSSLEDFFFNCFYFSSRLIVKLAATVEIHRLGWSTFSLLPPSLSGRLRSTAPVYASPKC